METVEQILECYARDIRRWTTMAKVEREGREFSLDLLATDPHSGTKYHFETGVLGSSLYGMMRANCCVLRNRADKFIETEATIAMVQRKFILRSDCRNVVVSWGWTAEATKAAHAAEIELWDFRQMVREIAGSFRLHGDRFTGETRRTIAVLSYSLDDPGVEPVLVLGERIVIASQDYWFQSEPYSHTWALIDKASFGAVLWLLCDDGLVTDRMEFGSVAEAEAGLARNGFSFYATDLSAQPWLTPPGQTFLRVPDMPPLYPDGCGWK